MRKDNAGGRRVHPALKEREPMHYATLKPIRPYRLKGQPPPGMTEEAWADALYAMNHEDRDYGLRLIKWIIRSPAGKDILYSMEFVDWAKRNAKYIHTYSDEKTRNRYSWR